MNKYLLPRYRHKNVTFLNLPTNPILHRGDPYVVRMYDGHQTSIVVDADVLRENYIPETLRAREPQMEQILCCLSPVLKKQKPIHAWLYGTPGTGKTTTAVHALRHLEEKAFVKTAIVNCWEKQTFYQILNAMISEFRILGAEENRTSFKLEKLRQHLKDVPLVVMLDEIDRIRRSELSTVLYAGQSTFPY